MKSKKKNNLIIKYISFVLIFTLSFNTILSYADTNNNDIGINGIDETVPISGDHTFDFGYMQGLIPIKCVKVSVYYDAKCRYYSIGTGPVNKQLSNHYVDTIATETYGGHSLVLGYTFGKVYSNGNLTAINFKKRNDSIFLPPNYFDYYLGYCGKTYDASGKDTYVLLTVSMSCTDVESAVYPIGGMQSFKIDF